MKILFVTASLHPGGSERVISLLANEFAKRGNKVEIICFIGREAFYHLENVSTHYISDIYSDSSLLVKAIYFRKYVKKVKPDIVISFMTAVYCLTLVSLFGTNFKIITSERIDPSKSSLFKKVIRKLFLPLTSYHVVQTREIKEYFSKNIQKKCSIIANPVVDRVFEVDKVKKEKRIINVARLDPQKDQKMLIDAFSIVFTKHPEYTLYIYGEGPMKEFLQSYIESKKMEYNIKLAGTTTYIIDELNHSEVFCLSSLYEGVSNSMLEAFCVGLPIVTTKVSGTKEFIKNEINGFVVSIGDYKSFAESIIRIIEDDNLYRTMSDNNRLKGKQLFSTQSVADQWLYIINKVLNS